MKTSLAILAISLVSIRATAMEINIELESQITTEYHECQDYLDNIKDLIILLLKPENSAHRDFILKNIRLIKEAFKKCEKDNNKQRSNTTIKIGASKKFSKKD